MFLVWCNLLQDCRPNKVTRYPRDDGGPVVADAPAAKNGGSKAFPSRMLQRSGGSDVGVGFEGNSVAPSGGQVSRVGSGGRRHPHKTRVLRTIYLPSDKADTLMLKINSLEHQIEKLKEIEGGRNKALLGDRGERVEQERARATADKEAIGVLEDKLRRAMEQHRR